MLHTQIKEPALKILKLSKNDFVLSICITNMIVYHMHISADAPRPSSDAACYTR